MVLWSLLPNHGFGATSLLKLWAVLSVLAAVRDVRGSCCGLKQKMRSETLLFNMSGSQAVCDRRTLEMSITSYLARFQLQQTSWNYVVSLLSNPRNHGAISTGRPTQADSVCCFQTKLCRLLPLASCLSRLGVAHCFDLKLQAKHQGHQVG